MLEKKSWREKVYISSASNAGSLMNTCTAATVNSN